MPSLLHSALRQAAAQLRPFDTRLWGVVGPLTELHGGQEVCAHCAVPQPCPTLAAVATGMEVNARAH